MSRVRCRGWMALTALAGLAAALLTLTARGQTSRFIQYGFETRGTVWVKGPADAPFEEKLHELTEKEANSGQRCEVIQLEAQKGDFIHYVYPVSKAPISEELTVSVWVKANRPGVRLLCRVVLPQERNHTRLDQPLTVLVAGDTYKLTDRWQQLVLREPVRRLREQEQLLRAERKGDVITAGAYVDQVILNVYSGPGLTTVYTDDLEVGPVYEERPVATTPAPPQPDRATPAQPVVRRGDDQVQLRGNPAQLLVKGERFFLRGIRHTGTPLQVLQLAGFNAVWVDDSAPPGLIESALNLGFWIVPSMSLPNLASDSPDLDATPGRGVPGRLTSGSVLGRKVSRFLDHGGVLCWDLGSNLVQEQAASVTSLARSLRSVDPLRPVSANVWDGYGRYSRNIDRLMLGVHRWPLMTGMEMTNYRDWLVSRRRLAQPGTYTWSWVQTHTPEWYVKLLEQEANPGQVTRASHQDSAAALALGPQPDQVRLLAYTALGAGCRGLGFWSDRHLADSHAGRGRLAALALLNHELHMLEPFLVAAEEPHWIDTYVPEVKAAVLRKKDAIVVLAMWMGSGSQFVPGQAAKGNVSMLVPHVPPTWQAWEVSPAHVKPLKPVRKPGGTEIALEPFGLTAAVVFTPDLSTDGAVVRFQDLQRKMRGAAAKWAYELAEDEFAKVQKVHAELEQMGHVPTGAGELLQRARHSLDEVSALRNQGRYEDAYAESQRAMQFLRILMRAQWQRAVARLTTPTASPFVVSFYTLPQHWRFWDQLTRTRPGANALAGGDFELPPSEVAPGWLVQETTTLDPVTAAARRTPEAAHQGRQALLLEIGPTDPEKTPLALERSFITLHSPSVNLQPGSLVRVSAWVNIPYPLQGSPDGALFYDSAGGEPLAVRLLHEPAWRQIVLYRRVPPDGKINVTMALTGLGKVYFDDVKIEPLN